MYTAIALTYALYTVRALRAYNIQCQCTKRAHCMCSVHCKCTVYICVQCKCTHGLRLQAQCTMSSQSQFHCEWVVHTVSTLCKSNAHCVLTGVAGAHYRLRVLRALHRSRKVYTEKALTVTLGMCTALCRCNIHCKCKQSSFSRAVQTLSGLTGAQCRCIIRCAHSHRSTVHVQCTLSHQAPVQSEPAMYTAYAQYMHSVGCKCPHLCAV